MDDDSIELHRSHLAIPASDPTRIANAVQSDADHVLFDLEDSLYKNEKDEYRTTIVEHIRAHPWNDVSLNYRINGISTRWWYKDIIEVVGEIGERIDNIVVPKVDEASDVRTVENLLRQVEVNAEQDGPTGIVVQIETATGLTNVDEIVRASDRLSAVVFGPGDYSASIGASGHDLGFSSEYQGHYWHYPLSRIVQAAASAGIRAIDGLYADIDSIDNFRKSCQHARMLGYDGKWVIHPNQVQVANDVFSPSKREAERAKAIIDTYTETDSEGTPTYEGKIIDETTYEIARDILKRSKKCGVI